MEDEVSEKMGITKGSTERTTAREFSKDSIDKVPSRGENRIESTPIDSSIDYFFDAPLSPSSSSSVDATFEPTIDMMVNDFDDEQTLNEEEALARQEEENVQNEIDTLREESEIPIEELLAKYGAMIPMQRNKQTKANRKRKKIKRNVSENDSSEMISNELYEGNKVIVNKEQNGYEMDSENEADESYDNLRLLESRKHHRSHLLDLYPENNSIVEPIDDDDCDEYDETMSDYRKSVTVGVGYQAFIPDGLSKYGDILPYENEDKLIWEPSQVGEKEVEEYLQKIRNIKTSASELEQLEAEDLEKREVKSNSATNSCEGSKSTSDTNQDVNIVVKDDEQALHLLVQCGYDFKEALRRKTLNVHPFTGSMSSWSEEECQKFEEGIKKFGKDFLKIRQQYVRTRSMREIVEFYYMWKKSDRSDQNFTNYDTVDHMDIYLNESSDFGKKSPLTGSSPIHLANGSLSGKKSASSHLRSISIMAKNSLNNTSKRRNEEDSSNGCGSEVKIS